MGNLNPFPLTEDQLCTFAAHLMEEGLQHSSIKGYFSAIHRLQIIKGLGDPFAASWPLLEYTLRGIKLRQAKQETRAKKRLPVTPDILRKLRKSWEKESHNPGFYNAVGSMLYVLFRFPQVRRGYSPVDEGV